MGMERELPNISDIANCLADPINYTIHVKATRSDVPIIIESDKNKGFVGDNLLPNINSLVNCWLLRESDKASAVFESTELNRQIRSRLDNLFDLDENEYEYLIEIFKIIRNNRYMEIIEKIGIGERISNGEL